MPFELFAGIRVGDYETAKQWFERLLGSEPAFFPNEIEAVWELGEQRWLYIIEVNEMPGGGLMTMLVDDLDARVSAISSRGIEPDEVENYPGNVRKVIYRDADGNEVGYGSRPAEP
jgi:hypothetical protein